MNLKIFLIYLLSVIPGILIFAFGKKRLGFFYLVATIVLLLGSILFQTEALGKFSIVLFIILLVVQFAYLIALFSVDKFRKTKDSSSGIADAIFISYDKSTLYDDSGKRVTSLTFFDIIKGSLFAIGLVVAYYLLPIIYALAIYMTSRVIDLFGFYPLRGILIAAIFIALIFTFSFSKLVESGFTLHTLFRTKKNTAKKED